MRLLASMALCAFIFGIYIHYLLAYLYFGYKLRQRQKGKTPPTLPHLLPIFGSVLSYLRDPRTFIEQRAVNISGRNPVAVQIGTKKIFFVLGSQNISRIWQKSSLSTSTAMHYYVLTNLFGMPKKAALRITKDDSGFSTQPLPGTNIKENNRIDHLAFHNMLGSLQGPGMDPFYWRFANNLTSRIEGLRIQCSWSTSTDFWRFVSCEIMPASLEAMCGPFLLSRNPNFCRDFWYYMDGLPSLSKGYPKFLNMAAHRARDSLLDDIRAWHVWARANHDESKVSETEHGDPLWGSKFMRERHFMFLGVDGFDYDAAAAEDLGAIFAANSNLITSMFWALYYVFRDPDLLAQARSEVEVAIEETPPCTTGDSVKSPRLPSFDIATLMRQPLLQSIFAETLRLRVSVHLVRYTEREDLNIGDWKFPKQHAILIPTSAAHMDKSIWNEGAQGEHPVNSFWADRFLVHPKDTGSRHKTNGRRDSNLTAESPDEDKPRFTVSGMKSAWIPFGGGPRICPGRHFAKRQILLVVALMITAFDIEFSGEDPGVSGKDYGTGAQRPVLDTPFRIKRRANGTG